MPVNFQGVLKIIAAIALALGASQSAELSAYVPHFQTVATIATALLALYVRAPHDPGPGA